MPSGDVGRAAAGLKDPNPKVRLDAVRKLSDLKDRQAVKPLIAALKDPDPEVGHAASAVLVETADIRTVELLIAALKDKSSARGRAWAAAALGRIKHPVAKNSLTTALNDPDQEVREKAAIALREFGNEPG
jgi:HEAT repeat protein